MENIVIVSVLTVIVVLIVFYLIRAKNQGKGCVGCPYAKKCDTNCRCRNINK